MCIRPHLRLLGRCGASAAGAFWLLVAPVHGAIAPGSSGNGELFLNVVDATARVSYALDLGVTMDAFFISAQQDLGYQRFWVVDGAVWGGFLGLTTLANLRWSVAALDSVGSLGAGLQRMYSTVQQGNEAALSTVSNRRLSDGMAQAVSFFSAVNALPGHQPQADYSVHGQSISLETDTGRGYYGETGGLTPSLNGMPNATNAVGQSSWFYHLTRSGTGQGTNNFITVDEFDNGGADGYWGFVKVEDQDAASAFYDPDSPFAGKYLLSFTMPVHTVVVTTAFREFAQGIGRTEYSGGFGVRPLAPATVAAGPAGRDAQAAGQAAAQSAGQVLALGAAGSAELVALPLLPAWAGDSATAALPSLLSPVPEPHPVALLVPGLCLLGGWALRRRGSAR